MALTKAKASNILLTTPAASSNDTTPATTQYVTTAINNLIDGAPATLNTLDEIAAALNDDAALNTTLTNAIAAKLPLAGGTMTGNLTVSGTAANTIIESTGSWSILRLKAPNTNGGYIQFADADDDDVGQIFYYHGSGGDYMSFTANAAERMRIDSNGNVGIGTNNPGDRLVVQKDTTNVEPILVIKNDNTTADNGTSIDFSGKDTGGNNILFGRIAAKYTNHSTEKSHLIFYNRNDSGSFTEGLRINHDMRMIVNGGTFSSLPTGSTLNVFGDGETLRLDGTGNTSKTLRFRGVSTSNPGIITADGSLKIQTEDAGTSININSIQDINYRTTDTNSTAGDHTFYSYNTPIFKLDGGTNYAELRGGSDVRMHFGSTGTVNTNSSNWIRGASSNLMYNSPGVHKWELSGTERMQLDNQSVLRIGQAAVNSAPGHVYAAGTLVTEAATSKNHRIIQRGYQDASGNITGNANETTFYEYGSYTWYTNVNTSASSRTYGMSLAGGNLKIGDYSYNNTSGINHYGGTGRTFMDINYNSYGAEIILVNNRTASGVVSLLQYRTNGVTGGSVRATGNSISFDQGSDYRLKNNIEDLSGSLDIIKSLQPRKFNWKEGFGPAGDEIGFIAHEVSDHMPGIVLGEKDGLYTQADLDEGVTGYKVGDEKHQTVSYSNHQMITRLVGAIKEQQTIIDDLKSRIETLEG